MAKKKTSLKEQTEILRKNMLDVHGAYMAAYEVWVRHVGQKVEDVGEEKVNEMLNDIQHKFKELHYALMFIETHSKWASNVVTEHVDFITFLKKNGVEETDPSKEKKVIVVTH